MRVNTNEIKLLFPEVIENFPNMGKGHDTQINEAYRTPASHNAIKSTPRHTIIKILEIQHKNRILKAVREKKQIIYKGKPIRFTTDFSTQAIKSRSGWTAVFPVLQENNFQPRLMYPAKLSFKINGESRYFRSKEQLKQFITTKPTLQRIPKDIV
ncbi:MAG: hypothetical protein HUJ62_05380 [Streptococcus gallolyticus]|nr:hypothetical protein [Streptococcus gallolyticus]